MKLKKKKKKQNKQTNVTLPIQYDVVLVSEGGEKDGEELWALLTSTSPRHPVIRHWLILQIPEVVEPTISFKIVAHIFEVRGANIQKWIVTHKHLDKELASLQKNMIDRIRKTQMKEIRQER
jgi:hypothetical protein